MIICDCVVFILLLIGGMQYGIYIEKKGFNKGVCPKCGKIKYFDMNSQGGRGYCCNSCKYYTWVSYKCVDKDYKK